ncbi:hypothetical protein QMZ92_30885 [Streptomyces sp. HNM0645]|uniref:hypothetical protein n=1 Tax=Streptomyces sp. HNM0645 TaxID=2782343 RepID=UPI0024B7386C|nr:hypothetical protein [Streptomyces sp. HNM0645]MDI9888648.1 hypothetical protein [Streptomyces sp. HNM0645]
MSAEPHVGPDGDGTQVVALVPDATAPVRMAMVTAVHHGVRPGQGVVPDRGRGGAVMFTPRLTKASAPILMLCG